MTEAKEEATREGWRARGAAFFLQGSGSGATLAQVQAALRRTVTASRRLLAARVRSDKRGSVVKRRERTRQLIELGGLVAKAAIVEVTDNHRAVICGALLESRWKAKG